MDPDDETHQDKKAISICAFAADIMSQMENDNVSTSRLSAWIQGPDVCQTLTDTMEILPLAVSRLSSDSLRLLDSSATALWNAFTRFQRRVEGEKDDVGGSIVQVPLLVCRMLECRYSEDGDSGFGLWKLFQVLIRSAEICLGSNMILETTHLLQRAALRVNSIGFSELADLDYQEYVARYHFLCAWMALKNQDVKDFDLHFTRVPQDIAKKNPDSREQYASMCLSAFRLAAKHGSRELAESLMPKLYEAFSILRQFHTEIIEYKKLVSTFFYTLATVVMKDMSETYDSLRSELLQTTEQDLEGPLGLFLQLEVMSRQEVFNKDTFSQSLVQYIENMEPTKDKFKRCLQYIFKLRVQDSDKAMMTLRLLYRRINVFTQDEHWLQQNFVALLRLVPSPPWKHSESLHFLTDLATSLNEILAKPLSTAESNAALIILWKYIESAWSNCDYQEAQAWCRLCQNDLFRQASPSNKAHILRKLMDCSFQTGDYAEVKSISAVLSEQEKDPRTIHVMYQVSLRDSDTDTAASLLASLIKLENGEHRYALASVAAAVTVCSQLRREALRSVYTLIEKYPIVLKKPINLDLHRALIRLIVYELREDLTDAEDLKAQMCEVLTWVSRAICQGDLDSNDHDWFLRCTYMLLLEASRDWAASHLLLILNVCLKLIDMYPTDVGTDVKYEISRRRISCNLLGMLIYTRLARTEQDPADGKSFYVDVTSRYTDIQNVMGSNILQECTQYVGTMSSAATERYHEIMCFYLEAVLCLEQWPDVEEFIRAASRADNDNVHSIMADMILTSEKMPLDYVIRSLEELFNSLKIANINRPRVVRCIFDLCMRHRGSDIRLCETILDQAHTVAKDMIFTEDNFPDEELEYLSTKAFNYSVDLYLSDNQTDAQRWARKSIDLSKLMRDDCGHLTLALQVKYEKWLTYGMDISD